MAIGAYFALITCFLTFASGVVFLMLLLRLLQDEDLEEQRPYLQKDITVSVVGESEPVCDEVRLYKSYSAPDLGYAAR